MSNKNQNCEIESTFEFGGFYGSFWESMLDGYIKNIFVYTLGFGDKFNPSDFDPFTEEHEKFFDYGKGREQMSELILDTLAKLTGVKMEFVKLYSPSQYNYVTDAADFKINFENINKLFEFLNENIDKFDKKFTERVKDITTPRDGYMPNYDFHEIMHYTDNLDLKITEALNVAMADDGFQNEMYDTVYNDMDQHLNFIDFKKLQARPIKKL